MKSILYTLPLFYFRECNPLMTPRNIWTGNLNWKSTFNILKQIWYCFLKCTEAVLTNFCAKILDLWYVRSTKAMSYLFFSSPYSIVFLTQNYMHDHVWNIMERAQQILILGHSKTTGSPRLVRFHLVRSPV